MEIKNSIIFSENACRDAKDKLKRNEKIMKIWNDNFAPAKAIGKCSTLITRYNPETYEEFFIRYVQYAQNYQDQPVKDRGLTIDELHELAKKYKTLSEAQCPSVNFDEETYLNDAICHIIVETFDGRNKERDIIKRLTCLGQNAVMADDDFDRKYGIDIICKNSEGKIVMGIQVKPHTFLTSTRRDVGDDRRRLYEKHIKTKNELGIETYYVVYNSSDKDKVQWLTNINGKICFKLDDLFEKNGLEPYYNIITKQSVLEKIKNADMWQ